MANVILWTNQSTGNLLTTELNALADGAIAVDAADYVNGTDKFQFADFVLDAVWAAACDADAVVELHIFYKHDNTLYADGEDGDLANPQPSGNSLHGIFNVGAEADVVQQILRVPLNPFDFKIGVVNLTGQAMAATLNTVDMFPYNDEIQ